jgi:hypothetical protein
MSKVRPKKTQDIDSLRGSIKKFMKRRREIALAPHTPGRFRLFLIRILPFLTIAFIIFTFFYRIKAESSNEGFLFLCIFGITLLTMTFGERLQLSPPPTSGEDEIEQWIWKKNLKTRLYGILLLMELTLIYIFVYINPTTQFILRSFLVVTIIVTLCYLLVVFNPKLFLSPFVNAVGTSGITVFVALYFLRLLFTNQFHWVLIGTIVLIPLLKSWWESRREQKLTLFQMAILQVVDIEKLFKSLRTYREILHDQSRALNLWLQLEDKFSYGEKEEFLRIVAGVQNSQGNRSLKVIMQVSVWLLIAILGAIVGLMAEDFLYTPIIKSYFCQLEFWQSWLTCS